MQSFFTVFIVMTLLGFGLTRALGPSGYLKILGWTGLLLSVVGLFAWRTLPYRYLLTRFGYGYGLVLLGAFFFCFGVLLGLWPPRARSENPTQ